MQLILKASRAIITCLSWVSPKLATYCCFKLFCNPVGRSSVRAPEQAIFNQANKTQATICATNVFIYNWGNGKKPVLLIHGWESRGSRFFSIVKCLLEQGYSPITFDMPGHGSSGGKNTTILECHEICIKLQEKFGPFEAVIGHSFGVPCMFYVVKNGLMANKMIAISGLADFEYLIERFSAFLNLNTKVKLGLKRWVEKLFHPHDDIWNTFSVTHSPERVQQPILIIHDSQDDIVAIEQSEKIVSTYGEQVHYLQTHGYGHKKILYQKDVIDRISAFLCAKQTGCAKYNVPANT